MHRADDSLQVRFWIAAYLTYPKTRVMVYSELVLVSPLPSALLLLRHLLLVRPLRAFHC